LKKNTVFVLIYCYKTR